MVAVQLRCKPEGFFRRVLAFVRTYVSEKTVQLRLRIFQVLFRPSILCLVQLCLFRKICAMTEAVLQTHIIFEDVYHMLQFCSLLLPSFLSTSCQASFPPAAYILLYTSLVARPETAWERGYRLPLHQLPIASFPPAA